MTLVDMRLKEASVYGYCLGYVAQGGTYNFMSAYFVLFLTNCVGMESSIAGTIASIALFAEVIAGIIVGNISDNCKLRMGRRRPFILAAAICMPIILLMISQTIKTHSWIYYLFFAVAFRIVFSTFEIPNNALGAEIATGYDERTALRTRSRAFSIIGNAIGYVLPLLVLSCFADNQQRGWQVIGIILASVTLISWFGSYVITGISGADKNVNLHKSNSTKDKGNILRNYYELVKLKPMRLLIIYKSAFSCAFALFNVSTIYYLSYCQNLKNDVSAYIWIYNIVIFVAMTPIVNKMALKYGKTNQQIITMSAAAITGILVFVFAPNNFVASVLYIGVFAAMQTSFWQLSSSIFYDLIEVDEYKNGKRREGDIMSFVSVLGTLVTAVMVQIFGKMLSSVGFNPLLEQQSESVINFLNIFYILIPSICFVIGVIALIFFPINKVVFNKLKEAIELKNSGLDYDEHILD